MSAAAATVAPPRQGLVRLVVLSDTHNQHEAVQTLLPGKKNEDSSVSASILIHCGDFADRGNVFHVRSFCRWLARHNIFGFDHVVVIDGNHDHVRRPSSAAPSIDLKIEFAKCNAKLHEKYGSGVLLDSSQRVHFLQDSSVQLAGLHIYGLSYKTVAADKVAAEMFRQEEESSLPDVVLSHVGPYVTAAHATTTFHHGSVVPWDAWRGGSRSLLEALQAYRPSIPLVLCGHVHWGRGALYLPRSNTWCVNASTTKPTRTTVQDNSRVTAPVIIDYDTQNRRVVRLSCPPH